MNLYKHFITLQNWMAFTDLRLENFTLTNEVMFNDTSSRGAYQDNQALCQVRFTKQQKSNF